MLIYWSDHIILLYFKELNIDRIKITNDTYNKNQGINCYLLGNSFVEYTPCK